jgi:hypothetical protein
MTDLQFEDAAPVQRGRGGRPGTPNPYTDVVAAIALQTYPDGTVIKGVDVSGQPIAKTFTLTHESADAVKTDRQRVNRLMSEAGGKNDPQVTVRVAHEDANTEEQRRPGQAKETVYRTRVTFWTTKRKGSGTIETEMPPATVDAE